MRYLTNVYFLFVVPPIRNLITKQTQLTIDNRQKTKDNRQKTTDKRQQTIENRK